MPRIAVGLRVASRSRVVLSRSPLKPWPSSLPSPVVGYHHAMRRRPLALLLALALLSMGCMSYRVRTFERVDNSDRTITVPPGGGLTGAVKEALAKEGWKITVYRGPEVTEGALGERTRLERGGTFTTRYAMFLRWNQYDVCVPMFDPAYNYAVSVVDNKNGSEVLTLSGRGCEGRIVDKLVEALRAP